MFLNHLLPSSLFVFILKTLYTSINLPFVTKFFIEKNNDNYDNLLNKIYNFEDNFKI